MLYFLTNCFMLLYAKNAKMFSINGYSQSVTKVVIEFLYFFD
jgi:hypothetical protein